VEVAVHHGAVVGFAAVRAGWLEHLNVHPDHQNRGIGTRLIEWAQGISPAGLDLWVFQRNTRARALYARHGWRLVALTDGDNEEGQPDAHLRWTPEPS
jgi:GNAT superfamily N-acetyltransferase